MSEPIKILHLEDAPDDAELICRHLKKAALLFDIKLVDNREDFKNGLLQYNPDIVLSDHSLPAFNSHEALSLLQDCGLDIPFILVTATVSEEFAVSIIKKGATDYVLKDRLQRLPTAITKAIETRKIEKEHNNFLQEIVSNETLMNDAQTLANFGSFSVALPNQEIKMSNEAYAIFGYAPGEATPKCIVSYFNAQQEIDKIKISIQEVSIDLTQPRKSYTLIDKNGRLKFISAEFKVTKNGAGNITAVKGFLYNVTRLKAAENMLQQSEANLKTIFETTDTGYILFSRDGKMVSFNKLAVTLVEGNLGLVLKEGMGYQLLASAERKDAVEDIFNKALAGESTTYEFYFDSSHSGVTWYFLRWLSVTGDNNRKHGVILAISDITERKLAEIENEKITTDLLVRNNALQRFSYIVSHNLRAPVANIMGISNILKPAIGSQAPGSEQFLDALDTSITKLDTIVNDLNHILNISQGENEPEQVVYFQQLVEEIKHGLSNTIHQTGAKITTRFFERPYTVSIKSFLHNIFLNLVTNSISFRKPGRQPHIHITSAITNNMLVLTFSDNGKGIDLSKFGNKIFGLYQRFDTSVDGKGLGLCITKTLTDNLGGTINVSSTVNQGTTFTLQLPLKK